MGSYEVEPRTARGVGRSGPIAKERPSTRDTPSVVAWPRFSMWEQLMLKRFHPRALFVDGAGVIWALYLFWYHDWILALAVTVAFRVAALASVWKSDPQQIAQTTMGKLALLHLHPINLTVQIVGAVVLLTGIWQQDAEVIWSGLSVILLGHAFGWTKFDQRLGQKT